MEDALVQALAAVVLLGISAASYRLHATDAPGSIAGFCLGLLIGLTSGWAWVAVLIAFLVVGSAATKYRYQFKLSIHAAEEKRGARGFRNVLANAVVATCISLLNYLHPNPIYAVIFVAAISSAAADTLATEIGLLSPSKPVLINRPFSTTAPGVSGGVTLLGEVAAVMGASVLAVLSLVIGVLPASPFDLCIAVLAGFIGCNVDSLLGGTVQALYSCAVCNAVTEKKVHCGQPTLKVKGLGSVGNNEVNMLSDAVAACLAASLYLLI